MTDPNKQPESDSAPDDPADGSQTPARDATLQASSSQQQPGSQPPATAEPATAEPAAAEPLEPASPTAEPGDAGSSPPTAQSVPSSPPDPEPGPAPAPPPQVAPQASGPGYTEPVPGAQRPRGSRRGVLVAVTLLAALLLVVCGIVGYLFLQQASENNAHEAGKCITQSGNSAEPADCDDDNTYEIIKRLDNTQSDKGCPASQTELYFVNESSDYVLCLKQNDSGQ